MKLVFLSVLFCLTSTLAVAHEYFFAFAEMEYNEVSQRMETTVTLTTHDLEKMFEMKLGEIIRLDTHQKDSATTRLVNDYILEHFQLKTSSQIVEFHMIGFETALNGTTNFYFESEPIELTNTFSIQFDVLMDQYPQQQNKITLIYRDKSYTYDFLSNQRTAIIKLD